MKHHPRLLLLLLLSGWGLRLIRLDGQSLWYDEGVTWMLSQNSLPDLIAWTARDIQPPFYYLLIWLTTQLWGQSEYALRLPSVIANTLTLPIIYGLSYRFFHHRPTALVATFITATAPVMIYYSQEARMYTLLVFEASLSSYLLQQFLQTPHRRTALSYSFITALAFYTHYFALFLWLTHGIYALFQFRRLPQLFYVLLSPFLWFMPWLPILFARLGDDPSYWSGTLKLDEALRKLIVTFTLGETVYEDIGYPLALIYLTLLFGTALHSYLTIPYSRRSPLPALLPLWLFLPPTLILALAYTSPKFNPRYTLVAWPAFALITAYFITVHRRNIIMGLGLTTISLMAAFSLSNWFTDPNFAKSDFRAVAQFVKERKQPQETVLLSSGHLYPVWAYYYGWQGWVALPHDMPTLDVNRITNLTIIHPLAAALHHKPGVWLVNWQDEVIDPNGVVPFWLDWVGERPHDAGDFWGVRLEHWRMTHPERLTQSPIATPLTFNFQQRLTLLGFTQLNDHEVALFWQAQQPLPPELTLTLNLGDAAGHQWARQSWVGSLGSYAYPPPRWPLGETVMTRHILPWQFGTPPGRYRVEIELGEVKNNNYQGWDIVDEQGNPQRRMAWLEPIQVHEAIKPPTAWQLTNPIISFSPIITLYQATLSQAQAEPGDRISLTTLWQLSPPKAQNISLQFEIVDQQPKPHPLAQFSIPTPNQPGLPSEVILGQHWLDIPPSATPGRAQIQVRFQNWVKSIGNLEILTTTRNFTAPSTLKFPITATFAQQITLLGLDCVCQTRPGQPLTLTLYWRGESPMEANYTIFAHILDTQDRMLLAADHAPPKPTRGWVRGEIIRDDITLNIPPELPLGDYPFEVGLYNAASPTLDRLPLIDGSTRVLLAALIKIEN